LNALLMSLEMRTEHERAMEEYAARFKIDTQNPASPTSPSVDAHSIGLGDNDTIPTRRASEERMESDLEHALDTIRKLVPSAGGMTNEELKEHLFAVCTAGTEACDPTIDIRETRQVAGTAEESIFRKYEMPRTKFSAVDITSPSRETFDHREAALATLPVLKQMGEFMANRFDGGEYSFRKKDSKAQIQTVLSECEDSVQNIGATDNLFLLSENFGVLHKGQSLISKHYLEDLDLAPHEKKEFDVLDVRLTARELYLSRQAVSTLHQGKAPSDLFSEHTHASRHFWGGGEELFSMSLAFP